VDGIHKLGNPLVDGLGQISAHFFHLKIASEFKHSQEVVDLLFIVLIELETTIAVVKNCVEKYKWCLVNFDNLETTQEKFV
jgi:hypothetical protein